MYFVRSKGRLLKLRDAENGKALDVGPRQWVPISILPKGMEPVGSCDIDVRVIACPEDVAAIDAENARMSAEDARRLEAKEAKAAAAAVAPAVEDAPRPRGRPRMR